MQRPLHVHVPKQHRLEVHVAVHVVDRRQAPVLRADLDGRRHTVAALYMYIYNISTVYIMLYYDLL